MTTIDELIVNYKPHEVDFVFPARKKDTPVYLDLSLLYQSPEERWHKTQALIYGYFNFYLKGYRKNQINSENLVSVLRFPEVPYIALGYCKDGFYGRGGATNRAEAIKIAIFDDTNIQEIGIAEVAKMSITIDNIGPDVLSDMVANFGIHHLLEYTNEQVEIFNLKTAEFQIENALNPSEMKWVPILKARLPYFENGEPRILVPRHLVRKLPVFSTIGFFKNFLRFVLKQEKEDELIKIIRTIGKKPKVPFKQVEAELKAKYGSLSVAIRNVAKIRPDLITKYALNPDLYSIKKRRKKLKENIDWDSYVNDVKEISPGKKDARNYAELLRKIFTALYGGCLSNGTLEQRSEGDIFHYDIDFANGANTPLFNIIRNQGIKGALLIIEAKNYDKTQIGNKEFNQSRGYTISSGRELVFLITRGKITDKDISRSRRHFLAQKILILPLADDDIVALINARRKDPERFDEIIIPRLQKILEA